MEAVQTASTTTASVTNTAQTSDHNRLVSSDFETFLKMLTAQMQNQDPLNPIESTDYAVQLATFSSVEQQVQTNDLLKELGAQMGLMDMAQFAGWVGMEARTSGPVQFSGSPITLSTNPNPVASHAQLIVFDEVGAEVQRTQIPTTGGQMDWAGVGDKGNPLPTGIYRFEVASFNGETLMSQTPAQAYSRVIEAQISQGQTNLVLAGGIEIASTDITALRDGND